MPDWWDTYASEEDDSASGGSGTGDAGDEADSKAALKARIAELPEGTQLRKLYEEALALAEEREAKAQADAESLAQLEAAVDSGVIDFDSETVRDAIRLQVQQRQAATDARLLDEEAALLRKQGFAEDYVKERIEKLRAEQASLADWAQGSDLLHDSPIFRAHELAVYQQSRSDQLAQEMKANRPGEWDREVEDAQAGIDSMVDAVLAGGA